jgi:hypothetical protein
MWRTRPNLCKLLDSPHGKTEWFKSTSYLNLSTRICVTETFHQRLNCSFVISVVN